MACFTYHSISSITNHSFNTVYIHEIDNSSTEGLRNGQPQRFNTYIRPTIRFVASSVTTPHITTSEALALTLILISVILILVLLFISITVPLLVTTSIHVAQPV